MVGDVSLDDFVARQIAEDPEYAKLHAIGKPFLNLCLNVWSLRLARGLTQQQLAEAAQMKQPRIADIERDEANPTLQTLSRIACALGVTAERLLAEPDEALVTQARAMVDAEVTSRSPKRRRDAGLLDDAETPSPLQRRRKTA